MSVIELKNVSKKFDGFGLTDINLQVPKGYIMGLIGPNGAGKTTLISMIMNTMYPDQGEVLLFNKKYEGNEVFLKNKIGFVYDDMGIYEDEKLKRLKSMFCSFYPGWDEERFNRYMKKFKLPLNKKFKELSKGMKMKFSLALALSHDAELLVLDEPTSGLDPVFRRELIDILSQILMDENKTILISSHITTELDKIADYVTFINEGKIILSEAKDDIIDAHLIIKGSSEVLKGISGKNLIGLRSTETMFEALIKKSEFQSDPESLGLLAETPNLEDIMFFYTKGEGETI
ncbi:ABC transporter ATP-binding protein [Bacillus infantis]|jgi:ABC-2 type transport system ATP-binding protein|uniref:ABC transporter ATP-binding protein n=1 Tax=Bacillus infantis TaxID=324767 RepID=UPI0020035E23